MTDTSTLAKVIAIGDFDPTRQQITVALGSQPEFQLVDFVNGTEKLSRVVHAAEPDIILVDHRIGGEPSLDTIDELVLQFPDTAVVAVLPDEDPVRAQQVMLAGARAFLIQPFTQVNLLSTLRRVRDLEARRSRPADIKTETASDGAKEMRTLAVYSPRGGVGCSTLAINLALGLQEKTNKQVLLLEGKLYFGHLDLMLNVRTPNTIADLIPHASALDDGLVKDVVTEHATGIHVLRGPGNVQVAQGIRAEDLFNVVMGIQSRYDYTVIDAGSALTENTVTLLDIADRVLLVTTPDLAALHDASQLIQISRTLAYPPEKMLVVLNRADMQGGVKNRDIEAALHHSLFAQIPDAGPDALRSLNRGMPLLLRYPRSQTSRAIQDLVVRLVGPPEGDRARENAKPRSRSGLLSKLAST
jgi:pilus assembly protein CpaE